MINTNLHNRFFAEPYPKIFEDLRCNSVLQRTLLVLDKILVGLFSSCLFPHAEYSKLRESLPLSVDLLTVWWWSTSIISCTIITQIFTLWTQHYWQHNFRNISTSHQCQMDIWISCILTSILLCRKSTFFYIWRPMPMQITIKQTFLLFALTWKLNCKKRIKCF